MYKKIHINRVDSGSTKNINRRNDSEIVNDSKNKMIDYNNNIIQNNHSLKNYNNINKKTDIQDNLKQLILEMLLY